MKRLVCISGKRFSGKDTLAVMIREHYARVGIPIEGVRSHTPGNKKAAK